MTVSDRPDFGAYVLLIGKLHYFTFGIEGIFLFLLRGTNGLPIVEGYGYYPANSSDPLEKLRSDL